MKEKTQIIGLILPLDRKRYSKALDQKKDHLRALPLNFYVVILILPLLENLSSTNKNINVKNIMTFTNGT